MIHTFSGEICNAHYLLPLICLLYSLNDSFYFDIVEKFDCFYPEPREQPDFSPDTL
jgi:hypothetical protein